MGQGDSKTEMDDEVSRPRGEAKLSVRSYSVCRGIAGFQVMHDYTWEKNFMMHEYTMQRNAGEFREPDRPNALPSDEELCERRYRYAHCCIRDNVREEGERAVQQLRDRVPRIYGERVMKLAEELNFPQTSLSQLAAQVRRRDLLLNRQLALKRRKRRQKKMKRRQRSRRPQFRV